MAKGNGFRRGDVFARWNQSVRHRELPRIARRGVRVRPNTATSVVPLLYRSVTSLAAAEFFDCGD